MLRLRHIFVFVFSVSMLGALSAHAQQQTQNEPIPAYRSPVAGPSDNGDPNDPQQLAPDNRSLTGAQNLSLGMASTNHSYWDPHVDLAFVIDSNPPENMVQSGWATWTSVSGGADLRWIKGNSDLTVSYIGGGVFSNGGDGTNGIIQDLAFVDRVSFHRWAFTLLDFTAYTPEIPFGSGGFAGIVLPGNGSFGPGPGLTFGQTIVTAEGQRLMNSSLGEVDVYLTPRASLTFAGGYSLLQFFDESLLNYGNVIGQAGFNYRLTRNDTIGVSYLYNGFQYSNFNQTINTNTIQLVYGRQITGRLAFQIGAGPEFAAFTTPITVGTGGSAGSSSSSNSVYWFLYTSLQYRTQRNQFSVSYNHGVAGGSGVLAGSLTNSFTGAASRQLSRTLTGTWNVGYARNAGIAIGISPGSTPSNQTYDYWYTGANLVHPIGRSFSVNAGYQLEYQTSNAAFCVEAACGTNFVRNLITIGVSWRKQPIPLD